MDDPLSRALREDIERANIPSTEVNVSNINEATSSLSISHSHNDWILPSTNERKEEIEINREYAKISVCDPKKHKTNLDSYVTYLVRAQTYNDGVQISESNVRRRYNDFVWLKNFLDVKYPFNIISPLPMKHTLSKKLQVIADDGEFIRRRMVGLQNFLQRILDNPVISVDPSVQLFLTADDEKLHSAQQQTPPSSPFASQITTSNTTNSFRPPIIGRGKPIPTEFSRTENQIQVLQDNFKKLERLTRKIETDEAAIQADDEHLLSSFKQWLDIERKYDENDTLVETIVNAQQTIVDNQDDLLKFTNTKFLEPINEYIQFTSIVQEILKRRSQLAEHVTTSNNEELFDQLTIANETIKADVQRWTDAKDKELCQLFHSLADRKVEFYNQSVNAWEQAAAKLVPTNNNKR